MWVGEWEGWLMTGSLPGSSRPPHRRPHSVAPRQDVCVCRCVCECGGYVYGGGGRMAQDLM